MGAREFYLTEQDRIDVNPDRAAAWADWFGRHGIDIAEVAVPGWVICEDGDLDRCIWYDAFRLAMDGSGSRDGFGTVRTKVQLEGRAMPFPDFAIATSGPDEETP